MDPLTRQHTTQFQGAKTSYAEMRRLVLEFVNSNINAKVSDPDAMVIGKVAVEDPAGTSGDQYQADPASQSWACDQAHEHVSAVTPSTQCYRCHGYGHVAT